MYVFKTLFRKWFKGCFFFTGICITEQNILMYNRLVYLYIYIREVRKIKPVYFDLR